MADVQLAAIELRDRDVSKAREVADLAAQQSMAVSANAMLQPSWAQVWIAAFGLIGLASSLTFTGWSLLETRRALQVQQESAELQNRAYLGIEAVRIEDFEVGHRPTIHVEIKNYGNTPAYRCEENFAIKYVPRGAEPNFDTSLSNPGIVINPQASLFMLEHAPELTAEIAAGFVGETLQGSAMVSIVGEVKYMTFGKPHVLRYASLFFGEDVTHNEILAAQSHSD